VGSTRGDGKREIGIVLVGQSQAQRLDTQLEPFGIPSNGSWPAGWLTLSAARLLRRENGIVCLAGAQPPTDQLDRLPPSGTVMDDLDPVRASIWPETTTFGSRLRRQIHHGKALQERGSD